MKEQATFNLDDLISLEHKLAELEHSNGIISHELYKANNRIAALETKLELFSRALKELRSIADSGDVPIDRPPHY